MRRAATLFLTALQEGRQADAYELLTSRFQEIVPKESFEPFLAQCGITPVAKVLRFTGDFSIGVDRGTVKPFLVREDGVAIPLELHMRREQMSWKVDLLDVKVRLEPSIPLVAANDPDLQRIEVRVSPSYWDAVRAQSRMLFSSRFGWVLLTAFPAYGFYLAFRWASTGGPPSLPDMIIASASVFAFPLYAMLLVVFIRQQGGARGPFIYAFDSEGFHVKSDMGATSKSWAEIPRVTESAGFLFIGSSWKRVGRNWSFFTQI